MQEYQKKFKFSRLFFLIFIFLSTLSFICFKNTYYFNQIDGKLALIIIIPFFAAFLVYGPIKIFEYYIKATRLGKKNILFCFLCQFCFLTISAVMLILYANKISDTSYMFSILFISAISGLIVKYYLNK